MKTLHMCDTATDRFTTTRNAPGTSSFRGRRIYAMGRVVSSLAMMALLTMGASACSDGGGGTTGNGNGGDACTNGCSEEGLKDCVAAGVRTCGQFDLDACLEWSEPVACDAGATCVEGVCAQGCSNECSPNSNQCGPTGGVQACVADADADACLEWGAETPCAANETCSLGQCESASECSNECGNEGDKQCSGNGFQTCGNFDADDCLDWGTVTDCAAGESCSLGECRAMNDCVNECAADSRQCAGNGFETCGDFDDDPCLEWSSVTACADGEVCSSGTCATTCANECSPSGQRQCSGNGTQVCGNHDDDECLEWGEVTACADDQTCSGGNCRNACVNECSPGARQCAGAGFQICDNFDDDECLEWSTVTACDENETCSGGVCAETCSNECGVLNQKQCSGNGFQVCDNHDEDPCLEWGTATACPQGQTCSAGECAETCTNECPAGARQCAQGGGGTQECGNFDEDVCLEWSTGTPCGDNETCSNGECAAVASCANECVAGNNRCVPGGFQTCGNFDEDSCTDWGSTQGCPDGQFCSNGECQEGCSDECPTGAVRCGGGGVQECGNFDGDACREWSTAVTCAAGEICSNGACATTCSDECADGSRQCAGNGTQGCGNFDDDSCLEWGEIESCQEGQTCSNGICATFCTNECEDGATRCGGGGVQRCGDFDDDTCLEWGAGIPCPGTQTCSNGSCSDTCTDECAAGASRCAAGGVQTCGTFDADDCLEWSPSAACAAGEVCDAGLCIPFVDSCMTDGDCSTGFVCVGGDCVAASDCVEDADCGPGETCDALTATCRPTDVGGARVGDNCAMDSDCGDEFVCLDTDIEGYCTVGCDDLNPCPTGSTCFNFDPDDPNINGCLRDCADNTACELGQACIPSGGPLGGSCDRAQCVTDSDCPLDNPLATFTCDAGVCTAPSECDLADGTGCADGETCLSSDGVGVCLGGCDLLMQDCPDSDKCVSAGGTGEGWCVPAGGAALGQPCENVFECAEGTLCIPDALGNGTCSRICDTSAAGTCGVDESCLSIGEGDVGICLSDCESECSAGDSRCAAGGVESCEQLDDDICLEWGQAVACAAGEGCDEVSGECIAACTTDADCGSGLLPVTCQAGSCVVNSECDPAEGTGCTAPQECFIANADGSAGVCLEVCDALDQDCTVQGEVCIAFGGGSWCLTPGPGIAGDACTSSTECGQGLACVNTILPDGSVGGQCTGLCDVADGDPACAAGFDCSDLGIDMRLGICEESCEDECVEDTAECAPDGGTRECGDFDEDACLEWSESTPCDDGLTCDPSVGQCRVFCDSDDDCVPGQAIEFLCNLATNRCEISSCDTTAGPTCTGGEVCVPQDPFGMDTAPGFCFDGCNPVTQDCPTDDGNCTFYPTSATTTEFVCLRSGAVPTQGECFFLEDCQEGDACVSFTLQDGTSASFCVTMCDVNNSACPAGETCDPVSYFPDPNVGICLP